LEVRPVFHRYQTAALAALDQGHPRFSRFLRSK
jgi:hypothetical protein